MNPVRDEAGMTDKTCYATWKISFHTFHKIQKWKRITLLYLNLQPLTWNKYLSPAPCIFWNFRAIVLGFVVFCFNTQDEITAINLLINNTNVISHTSENMKTPKKQIAECPGFNTRRLWHEEVTSDRRKRWFWILLCSFHVKNDGKQIQWEMWTFRKSLKLPLIKHEDLVSSHALLAYQNCFFSISQISRQAGCMQTHDQLIAIHKKKWGKSWILLIKILQVNFQIHRIF